MIITVDLGSRTYDVVLEGGARRNLADFVRTHCPRAKTVALVTTPSLARLAWFDFATTLDAHLIEVPEGESAKTFATLEALCDRFAQLEMSRDDVVVGVGGGAITDLVGFAAAVYLRGIGVVHVPTTLVGQVDAAIGGKTAINVSTGKNLVGAFHQPLGVFCDYEVLETLPERERLSGMGEVAKCWLLEGRRAQDLDDVSLTDLVAMSVNLKARIVSTDEFEGGERALLNYGHTLGHAIEILALARDVDELRHGEAVAVGLAFAVRLAHALGRVESSAIVNHDEVLRRFGLGAKLPSHMTTADIVAAMGLDKKAHHDLTFVLLGATGFEVVRGVERAVVVRALDSFRGEQ